MVSNRVTPSMNVGLIREFTGDEVDQAINQTQPLKAPRPDGFGACFFQMHWETVGDYVRRAVLAFLNHGIFYSFLNSTHIALIPKLQNAASVNDFRPISLYNVLYKIIAKVLANRLK